MNFYDDLLSFCEVPFGASKIAFFVGLNEQFRHLYHLYHYSHSYIDQ